MPRGRRYYDPFVQAAPAPLTQPQPISGLLVEKPGLFLHVDEVVVALRQMADEAAAVTEPMTPEETLRAAAASFAAIHEPA